MKKIIFYSLLLFWWCLMFPSNSYITFPNDELQNLNAPSFSINNTEIRFKFLDFLLSM